MTEREITPTAGHNQPPDDLAIALEAVVEDAGPYLTGVAIPDDDAAAEVARLVERAIAASKAVKDAEEGEKRPHLDATAAIRKRYAAAYADALKGADRVAKAGKQLLGAYQRAKEARRAEEARNLAEEAGAKAEAARKARQDAAGDLDAMREADEMADQAKTTEIASRTVAKLKVAPKVGGRALRHRKTYTAETRDVDEAIGWAWGHDFDAVWRELRPIIERMAVDHIKAGDKPAGRHEVGTGIVVTVGEEAY